MTSRQITPLVDEIGGPPGQRGGQQEPMPEQAVDEQDVRPRLFYARQVVVKGRTHIGAHFGDLGLGEGRMDRDRPNWRVRPASGRSRDRVRHFRSWSRRS